MDNEFNNGPDTSPQPENIPPEPPFEVPPYDPNIQQFAPPPYDPNMQQYGQPPFIPQDNNWNSPYDKPPEEKFSSVIILGIVIALLLIVIFVLCVIIFNKSGHNGGGTSDSFSTDIAETSTTAAAGMTTRSRFGNPTDTSTSTVTTTAITSTLPPLILTTVPPNQQKTISVFPSSDISNYPQYKEAIKNEIANNFYGYVGKSARDPGYALADLNADGIPELITYAFEGYIVQIFTIDNNKAVKLASVSQDYMDSLWIYSDCTINCYTPNAGRTSNNKIYKYDGGSKLTEIYRLDYSFSTNSNGDNIPKYTYTEKGVTREISSDDYTKMRQLLNEAFYPPASPLSDMGIIDTAKLKEKLLYKGFVSASDTISMWDVPSENGRVITQLTPRTKGDVYSVEGYPDWYKFCPDGSSESGYVSADSIKELKDSVDIEDICMLADSLYGKSSDQVDSELREWLSDLGMTDITDGGSRYNWSRNRTVNGQYIQEHFFKIKDYRCFQIEINYDYVDKSDLSSYGAKEIRFILDTEGSTRRLLADIVSLYGDPSNYSEGSSGGISCKFNNTAFTKGELYFNYCINTLLYNTKNDRYERETYCSLTFK